MIAGNVQGVSNLSLKECCFLLDIKATGEVMHFGLEASFRCDTNLSCRRWLFEADVADLTTQGIRHVYTGLKLLLDSHSILTRGFDLYVS